MKSTTTLLILSTLLYTSLAAPITTTNVIEKRATTGNADKEVGPGAWIPAGNYIDAVEKRTAEAEAHEGAVAPATMSYATIAYAGAEEK